ncbi:MAG: FAD-dependent oxidoreductase, partial [Planctomycetota bacterium]
MKNRSAKGEGVHRGLSRRDALAAIFGLPIALASCRTREGKRLPPGEIVGASHERGHLLRVGISESGSRNAEPPKRVTTLIVGGGVAGLSAAWRLRRAGETNFALVELEDALGGNSRSAQNYPWGAHYLPSPLKENRALIELLGEMSVLEGVDDDGEPVAHEHLLIRDPQERVYYRSEE